MTQLALTCGTLLLQLALTCGTLLLVAGMVLSNSSNAADEKKPAEPDLLTRLHNAGFDDKPFSLIVELHLKPGSFDKMKKLADAAVAGTHKEPGNLMYDFVQNADDPNVCFFLERFKNTKAMEAHIAQDYTKTLLAAFGTDLVGPPKLTILEQLSPARK